ncbi:MAG: aldo/keto reductase [Ignavibacteria bacterium RIFOXYB2_FULL_35_12]|nr:MAG: aldo/keto reductase [Ignavibacteria bacterium GWA2_36_19]OGU51064.1 MAG: aldo/keto reductase [Ignavibacteria bacterium GWC2_35_8]OGU56543.1 MAG: aldo/keto reductase [Ignavibacteria bacterium GWF2_35_20]OGU83306.1 MAG: aldo/keto reductase [Ignavibacteria bacterium RIFOXYA2_FULL_35_9]OGU85972.1 MAG: aldo/keto reductase [Ignavibacteria bacterium RIFOXYA12_FULL_35_25]OGU97096.1 MAG: aldo/keto reductase [Ignavibacteria bacterium RIFOXYB12_FULL_35_14]OGU99934.1 MAG: aldo/keto reductase [Ign
MRYRFLGNSGLQVSEICFGVMTFTGKTGWTYLGIQEQKDADRLTSIATDNGVNFFDTADVYSTGISETILGKALGKKRKDVVIATKGEGRMGTGLNDEGHSRQHLIRACNDSLKRLNTDYIDLYQVHAFDFMTPLEEMMMTLDQLVKDGKVRYIGISNFFAWQIMKLMSISEKQNIQKIISLQAYYSLVGRDLEYETIPVCLDQRIGIIVWSPLHGGILSGKYRKGKKWPKGTRLKGEGQHFPYDVEKGEKILLVVDKISKQRNVAMSQIALNYALQKPGITSVIIGARNEKQLLENIRTRSWKLTDVEMKRLDEVSEPPRIYPHWYFDVFKKKRMERYFSILAKQEVKDGA